MRLFFNSSVVIFLSTTLGEETDFAVFPLHFDLVALAFWSKPIIISPLGYEGKDICAYIQE